MVAPIAKINCERIQVRNVRAEIETGRQRGAFRYLEKDGGRVLLEAAIQKKDGCYKTHICEIREDRMAEDNYDRFIIKSFSTVEEALTFIQENSPFDVDDLMPCKGQIIFNASHPDCDNDD